MQSSIASAPTLHTPNQVRTYGPKPITGHGAGALITATVSFDDRWGNGHNTFTIRAEVTTPESRARRDSATAAHVEIASAFPELAPLLKWHLCTTDGPMHYIENTLYWLGRRGYTRWDNARTGRKSTPNDPPNFAYAKTTAIWPDMPESFVITGTSVATAIVKEALNDRLPAILADFRTAIETLGLVW